MHSIGIVLAIINSSSDAGDEAPSSVVVTPSYCVSKPPVSGDYSELLTFEQFNKIAIGMNSKQVVRILGCAGQVQSETLLPGYHQIMIEWKDNQGREISLMFQNNKVIMRMQRGLQK